MKSRNAKAAGALHPVFFFAVVYVVVLFFSIFICSSIFNSFNSIEESGSELVKTEKKESLPMQVSTAAMVR